MPMVFGMRIRRATKAPEADEAEVDEQPPTELSDSLFVSQSAPAPEVEPEPVPEAEPVPVPEPLIESADDSPPQAKPRSRRGVTRVLLALFVVAGPELTARLVRGWMSERLPAAMRPSRISIRSALPRTTSGKVDRIRLASEPTD